ncbi:MAG TPA: UDP-N-acetylmuramate--L-alanine ligase [Actinomycetota bacterium]|nr:UDP-N-acetylmuramate--L-alanine ligase [Actinomycetota bacterium]
MGDLAFRPGSSVHFVGIGGAGMSAIAKVLLERGVTVSGSDLKASRPATLLEAMGARVAIGHDAAHVSGADVVVVSSAIPERNPELRAARDAGLRVAGRGEALAAVLRDQRSIVVAGTHGKTTTTSMIVSVLRAAGRDPTYLVGGGLNDAGTNAKSGRDDLAVAESDESDGSFLLLRPAIAVVTNVEPDHVDYWESEEALLAAFEQFVASTDPSGTVVAPAAQPEVVAWAQEGPAAHVTFGEGGDVAATSVRFGSGEVAFDLEADGERHPVHLRVPGHHNVMNALAAAAACRAAGLPVAEVAAGLGEYRGVERRWHMRGEARGVTVIDDYAHHPTEVSATLGAARPGPWGRVVAVFQPHRYSRTRAFAGEFGASFAGADRVVVTDVYGAGEEPVPGVTGKLVADAVCRAFPGRPVAYLPHRDELVAYLAATSKPGDAVLTLGAGDVTAVGEELLERIASAR